MNKFFISNSYNHFSHKRISVMAVVRGNIDCTIEMVKNVFETSSKPENIELLIRMDDDDESVKILLEDDIFDKYNTKLYVGFRHGYININKYYNELVTMTTGDILFHWGNDGIILTEGWDNIFSSYIGKIVILHNTVHYDHDIIGIKAYPLLCFSPVITRGIYDILQTYSPCALSDSYYDYVAEIAGIKKASGVDILLKNDGSNKRGMEAWGNFSSEKNMIIVKEDAQKIISFLEENCIPRRTIPYFVISFNPNPKLEIKGGPEEEKYFVKFINKKNGNTVFSENLRQHTWAICFFQDYVDWKVEVFNRNKEKIFYYNFNLKGKTVLIEMDNNNIDEVISWMGYVEQFQKKYKCKTVCLSYHSDMLKNKYRDIEIFDISTYPKTDPEIYAYYKIIMGMGIQEIQSRLGL